MSKDQLNSPNVTVHKRESKDSKRNIEKELFKLLKKRPLSRRTAATLLDFPDQTYMVTQAVKNLLRNERAQIIGVIKCERSGRKVQAISTDVDLFKSSNQLKLF